MNYIIFEYCHIKHPHIRPQFLLKPFSLKHHLNISKHPPLWRLFLKKTCTVHPRQNPRWSGSFPQRGEWVISLGIVETLRRSKIFQTRQGRTSQGGFESQWYLRLESFILCQKVLFCEAKLMLFFCLCFLLKKRFLEDVLVSTIIPFSFLKYIICVVVAKSIAGFSSWSFSPSSQPTFIKGGDHCRFAHRFDHHLTDRSSHLQDSEEIGLVWSEFAIGDSVQCESGMACNEKWHATGEARGIFGNAQGVVVSWFTL